MANSTPDDVEVVVVGGGFCGVALAAALRHFGVSFVLLEAGREAGAGFGGHYDRLRLHTPRHRLPHDGDLETSGSYPLYKSKSDLVRYLNEYCALHRLRPGVELHYGTPVASVSKAQPRDGWATGWTVTTQAGQTFQAKMVALCTGAARLPHVPNFASREQAGTLAFVHRGGEVVHSRHYGNGQRFAGKTVAVVGSGNSAAEICVDLVEHGATSVTMVVNGPRHFLDLRKLSWVHWIEQALTNTQETLSDLHYVAQGSPEWAETASQVDQLLHYFSLDLSEYGIQRPELGPESERARLQKTGHKHSRTGRESDIDGSITTAPPRMPTLDIGLAPLLANVCPVLPHLSVSNVRSAEVLWWMTLVEFVFAGSRESKARSCRGNSSEWVTANTKSQWWSRNSSMRCNCPRDRLSSRFDAVVGTNTSRNSANSFCRGATAANGRSVPKPGRANTLLCGFRYHTGLRSLLGTLGASSRNALDVPIWC